MPTLVFLEHHGDELQNGSLGVLAKAASLGEGELAGALVGSGVKALAGEAGKFGAAKVYIADDPSFEAPLPAVIAVSDAINEPRYPSLKGIMGAKSKPQETVRFADLGLDGAESRTEVLALNDPPPRGESRKVEDDGDAAQAVLDFLAEKRLV